MKNRLVEFVRLVLEGKMREADLGDDTRVPWGDEKHIKELEGRIFDLTRWRDRQRRGSEARANYARLIGRLRAELRSAKRAAERRSSR